MQMTKKKNARQTITFTITTESVIIKEEKSVLKCTKLHMYSERLKDKDNKKVKSPVYSIIM